MVPLLFWIIQSIGAFLRFKLYEGVQENNLYRLEFLKSIGFNFCCIALAIDFGLLSQYKGNIFEISPNFVFYLLLHLLAWIVSIGDQIVYKYIALKSNNSQVIWWKILIMFICACFIFIGAFCLLTISKMVQ